jgi:hypothetical protein
MSLLFVVYILLIRKIKIKIYSLQKWWEKAWKRYKEYIALQKLSTKIKVETQHDGNITRMSVRSQTQHPLRKNSSFKVNLHTSEDQNDNVEYLDSVKHTKLVHEPYIDRFVTTLDSCSESFLSRVYTSFIKL